MNGSTAQGVDQTVKGGVLGLFTYFGAKYNVDPGLLAVAMPLLAGVMAFISSKIGDPHLASVFSGKKHDAAK